MDDYTRALDTIEALISEQMTRSPLDALSSAHALRQHGDDLVRRAVEAAVGTHSWSEIGAALGVSRQAAHKRFAASVRR